MDTSPHPPIPGRGISAHTNTYTPTLTLSPLLIHASEGPKAPTTKVPNAPSCRFLAAKTRDPNTNGTRRQFNRTTASTSRPALRGTRGPLQGRLDPPILQHGLGCPSVMDARKEDQSGKRPTSHRFAGRGHATPVVFFSGGDLQDHVGRQFTRSEQDSATFRMQSALI